MSFTGKMTQDSETDMEDILVECDECGKQVLSVYIEDGTCDECRIE